MKALSLACCIIASTATLVFPVKTQDIVVTFNPILVEKTVVTKQEVFARSAIDEKHIVTEDKDRMSKTIGGASSKYGVPVKVLFSVIKVESNFKAKKTKYGLVGYAQISSNDWDGVVPHNIYSQYDNIFAGAWILKSYHEELKSWEAAVMAYNIGITAYNLGDNMDKALTYKTKVFNYAGTL